MIRRLIHARDGATAAEFALVLPLFLLLMFAVIDGGRLMWTWNKAEKATQMGVRFAAVTDMVASGLGAYDFVVSGGLPQGEPVPASSFGKISCTSTACTCVTAPCPSLARSGTAFTNIVARMALIDPAITAANVTVAYENVGLGFAGDPDGPDVAPLITVSLRNMEFQPLTLLVFGASIDMPSFSAALTMEDGTGTTAN